MRAPAPLDRVQMLDSRIAAATRLHRPRARLGLYGTLCTACWEHWPCRTAIALHPSLR